MGSTDSRNSEDNIYDVLRTDILNLKLQRGLPGGKDAGEGCPH